MPALRVLTVEDSSSDARTLRALLHDADPDCELTHVRSLKAAEEKLRPPAPPPEVLLLDLGLPDGDGIENVERMRAAAPDSAIVVLTGRDDDGFALQALRSGAQEYLVKGSYDGELLLRTMRHAIERHGLMRELNNEREREYYRASHDLLTGLPNRQLFQDRAQIALHKAVRAGEHLAVCFIDLDGFKPVNDRHGHAIGDALLREVAHVLRDGLRDSDTVARVGGDEFIVLLSPVSLSAGDGEARIILQRLVRRLSSINRIGDRDISIGASAGIALFPADGSTLEVLMDHADAAMYQAKRSGKGKVCMWSDEGPAEEMRPHLARFEIGYLPWLDRQGQTAGYCALPPPGLAAGLSALQVLAQALDDWRAASMVKGQGPRLAIPVVAAELQRPHAARAWLEDLRQAELAPSRLRLCLPASELAQADGQCIEHLGWLRDNRVQVALTDVAAKDLSLARLADWPLDAVVLDPAWTPLLVERERQSVALLSGLLAFQAALGRELMLTGVGSAEVPQLREQFVGLCLQGQALLPAVSATQLP